MDRFMKENSVKANPTVKDRISTSQPNMMTLNNIMDHGMLLNHMGLAELSTTMAMSMKVSLLEVRGQEVVLTGLIKFINTLASGNIIAFGVKASFIKINKSFSKDFLKKA